MEAGNKHNSKTSFSYSNAEISDFFEEINSKLDKLQEYANDDFIEISRNIKNYHNTAKNIYKNIKLILSLISDDEKNNYLKKLPKSIKSLVDNKYNILGSFTILKEALLSIKEKTDKNTNTSKEFVALREHLNYLINTVESNESDANEVFVKATEKIKQFVYLIIEDKNKAKKLIPMLESKINEYYNNLNKIIVSIQYHDIIRQKIDHISIANKEILNELTNSNIISENKERVIDTKYIYVVPEILSLQSAILDHTNNECQVAFFTIKNNLSEVLNNISELLNISTELTNYHKSNNVENVIDFFDEINQHILKFGAKYDLTQNPLLIEFIKHDINITNTEISENLIKSLTDDLVDFSSDFKETYREQAINLEIDSISKKLSQAHAKYLDRNQKIEEIILHSSELNKNLNENIKPIIERIQNSFLFSKIINELISKLSVFYEKTSSEYTDLFRPNVKEKLEFLYSIYSMESEREIHNKLFDIEHSQAPEIAEDDDEVEFF